MSVALLNSDYGLTFTLLVFEDAVTIAGLACPTSNSSMAFPRVKGLRLTRPSLNEAGRVRQWLAEMNAPGQGETLLLRPRTAPQAL